MPVLIFSDDPRGIAFLDNAADYVGRDGVIVTPAFKLDYIVESLRPYFASLGAPQEVSFGRSGKEEIRLALIPAHGLTRPFPLPYPRSAVAAKGVP